MGFEPVRGVTVTYIIFYSIWKCRGSPVVAMKTADLKVSSSSLMLIKKIFFSKFNFFKRFFLIIL